jgi:hypothetical protein
MHLILDVLDVDLYALSVVGDYIVQRELEILLCCLSQDL